MILRKMIFDEKTRASVLVEVEEPDAVQTAHAAAGAKVVAEEAQMAARAVELASLAEKHRVLQADYDALSERLAAIEKKLGG